MLDFKENIELLEKVILNFVLVPDDTDLFVKAKNSDVLDKRELMNLIKSFYFLDDKNKDVFRVSKKYYNEHNRLPSRTEIKQMLNLENSRWSDSEIDSVFALDLREYGYQFLNKYTKAFVMYRNLNSALTEMISDLKTRDITPDNIDDVVNKVRSGVATKLNVSLSDTKRGINFFDADSHIQLPKTGNPTGFEFLNKVLDGGWNPKTLVIFQARPKCGKTMVLANIAGRAMLRGVNVGVATLELSKQAYTKRIGSNILSIQYKEYDKFTKSSELSQVKAKLAALKANNPDTGELWIEEFETGNASALDIENYFLKIEQSTGKKFGVIVVDYLNLMKQLATTEDNTYMKIKKISEELRAVAIRNEWSIISATQIKRDAVSKSDMGMEDVAESFGLIHTVDTLFGLIREPLSKVMKVKVITNRDGGHTESYQCYDLHYDYARMVERLGSSDFYYSDEDQTAELEAELLESYSRLQRATPSIETELQALLISEADQSRDYDADEQVENPITIPENTPQELTLQKLQDLDDLANMTPESNSAESNTKIEIKVKGEYDDILNSL